MILNGRQLTTILPLSDLYTDYKSHRRLGVFVCKGRECVTCDRVGELLLITEEPNGAKHVDLYTRDFVMMTVDHATPKSVARALGWSKKQIENMDNKQTMCGPCNWSKGSKDITNEELKKRRSGRALEQKNVELIRQFVDNESIFSKSLDFA